MTRTRKYERMDLDGRMPRPERKEDTMKNVTKSATVTTAYGNTLPNPITFSYSYVEYEKGDTIPASELPDEDGIRSFVNGRLNAAARSKEQASALEAAGVKKPTLEDPNVQLATMIKVLMAAGRDEATATQIARTALGL